MINTDNVPQQWHITHHGNGIITHHSNGLSLWLLSQAWHHGFLDNLFAQQETSVYCTYTAHTRLDTHN